jgi:glycosyltransferase involved in cell wall biosynthesis
MHERTPAEWQGVSVVRYSSERVSTPGIHPWAISFETQLIRAEACYRKALEMRAAGYEPDLVIAHPGWGESLFLKEVWPRAKLGIYCEFYYAASGLDIDFDPEFPSTDLSEPCRQRLKNLPSDLHFGLADAGLSPTRWQADTFPEPFRNRITVIHDGIDTAAVAPKPEIKVNLAGGPSLSRDDEVVTFVNRDLEPLRGYHVFMRALPELLARRPGARVVLVGGDRVSYGRPPADAPSWRQKFVDEVRPRIKDQDWSRVHFVGQVPYDAFLALLQLSTVHVYLTYPFVLSWSLLEAMSAGCAIVASDTGPVREVISDGETGRLVDFFDVAGLTQEVCALLDDPEARARLGRNARAAAQAGYDLRSVCLPRQLEWVDRLAAG